MEKFVCPDPCLKQRRDSGRQRFGFFDVHVGEVGRTGR
jgi:hypothetical protein